MTLPQYREKLGSYHESASNGNMPKDQMALKLYCRSQLKVSFPDAARMMSGRIVQLGVDHHKGLIDFSPIQQQQEGVEINEAIRHALTDYQLYNPRTFDDGKDKEELENFQEYIPDMIKVAVEGLNEYFQNVNTIDGEYGKEYKEPRIDVPILLYQDYSGGGKQIDLKCHLPLRNPPKKDGTRTWRVPKPKTEPSDNWVKQQAVYWKATGQKPALLSVTASDYNIIDETNCELLQEDNLQIAYNEMVKSWEVTQNLLKASNGSWKTLCSLIQPDMNEIARMHGPEFVQIAKQLWEY